MRNLTSTLVAFTLVVPGLALAAPDKEITMQVIDGDTPRAVNRQIELPGKANERAQANSADGLETANQARERNRYRVSDMAQENEDALRERRQEMHEQRQQMREQRQETQEQLRQQQESTRDSMQNRQTQ